MQHGFMRIAAIVIGAVMVANGIVMLAGPAGWYGAVPGVAHTGPLNVHFVRDIGIAGGVAGAAIVWGAFRGGWIATAVGAALLAAHSVLHIVETILGHHHDVLGAELLTVHAPAWAAVTIAFLQRRSAARA
jgi:hypothetical protein